MSTLNQANPSLLTKPLALSSLCFESFNKQMFCVYIAGDPEGGIFSKEIKYDYGQNVLLEERKLEEFLKLGFF